MKVNESKYKLVVNHVINDIDKIKNYSEKVNVCFFIHIPPTIPL